MHSCREIKAPRSAKKVVSEQICSLWKWSISCLSVTTAPRTCLFPEGTRTNFPQPPRSPLTTASEELLENPQGGWWEFAKDEAQAAWPAPCAPSSFPRAGSPSPAHMRSEVGGDVRNPGVVQMAFLTLGQRLPQPSWSSVGRSVTLYVCSHHVPHWCPSLSRSLLWSWTSSLMVRSSKTSWMLPPSAESPCTSSWTRQA